MGNGRHEERYKHHQYLHDIGCIEDVTIICGSVPVNVPYYAPSFAEVPLHDADYVLVFADFFFVRTLSAWMMRPKVNIVFSHLP